MEPTFKILQPLTCGFQPNEVRAASEFPKGTDFKRLVELEVVRPTNLSAVVPGSDEKADLMDEIEDLQFKLERAERERAADVAERDTQISALTEENKALKARVAELELQAASAQAGMSEPKLETDAPPADTNPTVPTPPLETKVGTSKKK